ncbi:MAG: E3 binding domain-containing protein [Actinomycetota bacterium]|nr:E3 binding domain-containing protein [Actinomycetota bacterium]
MAQLKVNELQTVLRSVQAEQAIYLTHDRDRAVAADDPEAAFLLASEGSEVSREDALRYGLVKPDKAEKEAAVKEPAEEPDATAGALLLAGEHGIDLASLSGSGKDGRIVQADVEAAIAAKEGPSS